MKRTSTGKAPYKRGGAQRGPRTRSGVATSRTPRCWCGNKKLRVFSPEYLRCAACETLVLAQMPDPKDLLPTEDDRGFYGRQYHESYLTEQLGLPSIAERARTDLPERCLHWLRTLLKHKLPPAKVLELGSAHGGFVALMRWTGFDATGLELSSWLVNLARETFGVPMLLGPVEQQALEPQSLDAVVLMDLVEHLHDPVGTLRQCLRLLKPVGILVIQTPQYRERKSYDEMVAEGDPFLKMLSAPQHLYLFSRRSIRELLGQLGASHLQFEQAMFPAYDMSLVASEKPLSTFPEDEIQMGLSATPSGRFGRALLDLSARLEDLTSRHAESEADRAARLEVIERQSRQLAELDGSRAQLVTELTQLREQHAAAEADRAARLEVIERQGRQLAELDGSRAQLAAELTQLREQHAAAEADRAVRLEVIEKQGHQLVDLDASRAQLTEQLAQLREQYAVTQADRAARLEVIERQSRQLAELETSRAQLTEHLAQFRERYATADADRAARLEVIERQTG